MNLTLQSAQVWHALSRNFTVLPAYPRVYRRMECTIPAFVFPAVLHLPIPEGWTAKLAIDSQYKGVISFLFLCLFTD